MKTPSKSQWQAMIHLSGPAQVIAGPGSGKTFTIIQRILYLIKHYHVRPDKILVITYTKAAANEMKERYEKAYTSDTELLNICRSGNFSGNVNFGTFHSICYNILRQCGIFQSGSLIKESDKRKLLQIILCNNGLADKSSYDHIVKLQNLISRMKNLTGINGEENREENSVKLSEEGEFSYNEVMLIKTEYDKYLREQGMLDFDDMITECLKLLSEKQVVRSKYQQAFEYILADEFQDINLPQYQILKLLSAPSDNLLVVGDDDQAIYGFRGATPGIMKQFMTDYRDGKQLLLTENFRSGANIVELAKNVISQNKERFVKEFCPARSGGKVTFLCFDTRKEEEKRLLEELALLDREQLKNTAVILRTNLEVTIYAELLRENGIAVKGERVKDTDIFHGFMMEDITAFLTYLYDGNQRKDFLKFMNKPNRFLTRTALPFEKVSRKEMEKYYAENPSMLSQIRLLFGQLEVANSLQPYLSIAFFRNVLGYDKYLYQKAGDYNKYQRLKKQADRIQDCFKQYKRQVTVKDFVEAQADKEGNTIAQMEEQQGISILTMHGAKGLEFERVFLPDVNDGIIPGKECIREGASKDSTLKEMLEEERRLLYVAITRAKNELAIYYTKERGRKPSRFLEGIIPPQ